MPAVFVLPSETASVLVKHEAKAVYWANYSVEIEI